MQAPVATWPAPEDAGKRPGIQPAGRGQGQGARSADGSSGPPGRAETCVLIVDDSSMNRDVLSRSLEQLGYRVRGAGSGREALEAIRADPVDVVLLDIIMPDLSGKEVLRRLRTDLATADLPVILVSGLDETEDIVQGLELGANDYVTKPINLPVLQARLATQTALKRARDELKQTAELLAEALAHNEHELQVAGQVQRSTLPRRQARSEGLDTAWCYEPASVVSGDLFDIIALPNGRTLLFLADAMGHGVQAALVVSAVKATLAAHLNEADDLPILMGLIDLAVGDLFDDRFVTAAACIVDPRAGRLRYSVAGHPPILLTDASGVVELQDGGLPLGTHLGLTFHGGEVELQPGAKILLYSDGVTEALSPDGTPFGQEALTRILAEANGHTAEDLIQAVRQAIDRFRGPRPLADDLTILAARLV